MKNYKYYTPVEVAAKLLELIPRKNYKKVIDICCGSWNLLHAAQMKFPNARYFGVDVDKEAKERCFDAAEFLCDDGRKFAIAQHELGEKYDLVLSNPPFGYISEADRVLTGSSIDKLIPELMTKRYEHEMMQANMLLLEENGILIFILPSTFVEGYSAQKIRRAVVEKFSVLKIVQLPIETFGSKWISTYALIMKVRKNKEIGNTEYLVMSKKGAGKYEITVSNRIKEEKILSGVWLDKLDIKLGNVRCLSYRGNITSSQMSATGQRILHCSSSFMDKEWKPGVRFCDDNCVLEKGKKVYPGDIVVNRIGKYAGYWSECTEESYISDCIIAFSASDACELKRTFMQNSKDGRLLVPLKGVSTKYVSDFDIHNLIGE